MSPWLFNIYMDGVMREVKGKVGEVGVKMYNEGRRRIDAEFNSLLMTQCTLQKIKVTYKIW